MSFKTSLMCKAGLVVYTCYRVFNINEFELQFKTHLEYVVQNLVTHKQEQFHIYVLFPNQLRFGEVLRVAYKCGMKPGIRDEGFLVITEAVPQTPAKL